MPVKFKAAILYATVALLLQATPALSHAELVSASPANGSTVPGTFKQVRLKFSEPILGAMSYFDLLDANQKRIIRAGGKPTCSGAVCQFAVEPLQDGKYWVRYHVFSDDGHTVEADYTFTVKNQ